ncbi:hypothetical protein OESDEN_23427 [Oesophagostomum dentatum]|uniref:Uncharacterized protein n=1 Tax=Oesophagostomum dentatum TaxID=61180 RepID=A0A0B1RV36_OESDE|nr:hypothetical protein OESDEN_23427 [Oesophagostomum dentatum]
MCFKLKLEVEYIGCTDENGLTIVWSDKWEFIAASYSVFKNLEFGIYRVEIVRQYVPNQFPRWKLKKIFDIVESYGSNSGKKAVERPRIHASIQASNERIGNRENKKNDDSGIDAEEEEGGSTLLKNSVGEETPRKRIEEHTQYRDVNREVEDHLKITASTLLLIRHFLVGTDIFLSSLRVIQNSTHLDFSL